MNKSEIAKTLTRNFHKIGFEVKKHSPEILVISGIAGTVASAVMACKATTKLNSVLEDAKDQIDKIHAASEAPETLSEEVQEKLKEHDYSKKDAQKDLTIVYIQTGFKLIKLYAPAIILGALSIAGIVQSNNILRKRNIAIAAAYTAIDKGFKEYRQRVVERFGEAVDKELRYDIREKEVEYKVENEDGTEEIVKKTVKAANPNIYSDYARIFDEYCTGWTKDPEYNLMFLKRQQNWANDKLKREGYLFLNEVYEMLGIPKTKAGQVVGWIYDEKNPIGDNYVDFGIYDLDNEKARDFVNGYERSIVLDFNVDGPIWDLMS